MDKFYVIANEASPGFWTEWLWSDVKCKASIFLDNNKINNKRLKVLKKLHFSNRVNKKIWIPFKWIWDKTLCISETDLNKYDRNYLIFQSNIKFSPSYIKKLKKEKNACIILYLPDTIRAIGIGHCKKDFLRYAKYYSIDYVFSFDEVECKKYGFDFFDIYSANSKNINTIKNTDIFYIGNCRDDDRRRTLIRIFEKLSDKVKCDFNLAGVENGKQEYGDKITYNLVMPYESVIEHVKASNCILELVNKGQTGNTLRFKEAVCYGKRLITNNIYVKKSKYYDPNKVLYFDDVDNIDINWITKGEDVTYDYYGEFSPNTLLDVIKNKDKEQENDL